MKKLEISNIKRIRIKPNDVLLVTVPKHLFEDRKWLDEMNKVLEKSFRNFKDIDILLCPDTVNFSIITKTKAMIIKMENTKDVS